MAQTTSGECNASVTSLFSEIKDLQMMPLENWVFLYNYVIEKKVQFNKNVHCYRAMLFMSKQVSLKKISLLLQKLKVGPKSVIQV